MSRNGGALARLADLDVPVVSKGMSRRAIAVSVLKAVETGDADTVREHVHPDLIQHNLTIASGRDALIDLVLAGPKQGIEIDVQRIVEDSETVVVQNIVRAGKTAMAVFDVYRFAGERIVEHWDNLQPIPEARLDIVGEGPDNVECLNHTIRNLDNAVGTLGYALSNRKFHVVRDFIAPGLIERAVEPENGLHELVAHLIHQVTEGGKDRPLRVYKLIAEGSFLFLMSAFDRDGRSLAMFQLFAMRMGKITEHWSVVATVPPKADWANENTKF